MTIGILAIQGKILLASQIGNDTVSHFGTIPMTVKRNAYGRQLGSFHATGTVKVIGEVPMTFIRAPYVSKTTNQVETLAVVDGKTVGVKYNNKKNTTCQLIVLKGGTL